MINVIADTRSDFDGLAATFNDPSWSRDNMQEYFKKIENLHYPVLNGDHGLDGWLDTTLNPVLAVLNPRFLGKLNLSCTFLLILTTTPRPPNPRFRRISHSLWSTRA